MRLSNTWNVRVVQDMELERTVVLVSVVMVPVNVEEIICLICPPVFIKKDVQALTWQLSLFSKLHQRLE